MAGTRLVAQHKLSVLLHLSEPTTKLNRRGVHLRNADLSLVFAELVLSWARVQVCVLFSERSADVDAHGVGQVFVVHGVSVSLIVTRARVVKVLGFDCGLDAEPELRGPARLVLVVDIIGVLEVELANDVVAVRCWSLVVGTLVVLATVSAHLLSLGPVVVLRGVGHWARLTDFVRLLPVSKLFRWD